MHEARCKGFSMTLGTEMSVGQMVSQYRWKFVNKYRVYCCEIWYSYSRSPEENPLQTPLTFPLMPAAGQRFTYPVKYVHLLDGLANNPW